MSFKSPDQKGAYVASCDDYAAVVLNNPWDMNEPSDINQQIPSADFVGFSNVSFANGVFSAVTTTNDPYFYLVSPQLCSTQLSGGRIGSEFPIDTTKYHKLSFRMYSNVASYYEIVWNYGCDYFKEFVITSPYRLLPVGILIRST